MNYDFQFKEIVPVYLTNLPIGRKRLYFQIVLTMKLTVLLIVLFSLKVSADAFAQHISVSYKNAQLKTVITELSKQSNYDFVFDEQYIKLAKPITLHVQNADINQVLQQLFKEQPFTYEIEDGIIYIKLDERGNRRPSLQQSIIKGRVTDSLNNPLQGVTVQVKGTIRQTMTDRNGHYELSNVPENSTLVFRLLSHQTVEMPANRSEINVVMRVVYREIDEVDVVHTGYQSLPRERAVGSFEVIDNELFNRRVSTNILERLNGITTGMNFRNVVPAIYTNPNTRNTGITVRGESTFLSSTEPLIVVDNFPFEGEISNINPNDVESITILKDATAASIWGARSGNGVIVITTKKGNRNEQMKVDFSSNLTASSKPDLFYDQRYLDASSFIEVEDILFKAGFFNSDITNVTTRPVVSPAVEIMNLVRSGTITETEGNNRLDLLRNIDVRNDYENYIYRQAINQQYHLGVRGGTNNMTYSFSTGYDHNRSNLIRNGFERISLNTMNTYTPVKNLELSAAINFSQNTTLLNNEQVSSVGGKYAGTIFPYAKLADENGNPLSVTNELRESYLTSAEANGYLDWRYRPIDEINLADRSTKVSSTLARFRAKYNILPQLSAEVSYQNERQVINTRNLRSQDSYYVRDLFNRFSIYNAATNSFTHNFPLGGMLDKTGYDWQSTNMRGQLNYNQDILNHSFNAILGSEIREMKTEGSRQLLIGYDDQFGTSVSDLNYTMLYPRSPSGSARLPSIGSSIFGILNRYVSYYANAAYHYDQKYTVTVSGRIDGANLFGAKTNDRFTPLWSAGLGWKISNEQFYDIGSIPYLQLRTTYGYNGNTYTQGSALLTGRYTTDLLTGAQQIVDVTAPNPELRWEKVRNINFGADFKLSNNVISGTIEYYIKNGQDLIQPTQLAPQTGFLTYTANTANTKTNGWDITLHSQNINRGLNWNTTLLFSTIKDRVVKYDPTFTGSNMSSGGGVVGKPLYAMYSYKWGGLNPQNGNPVGYLNGVESENYSSIINNLDPDSLVYAGSMRPTVFGALRNNFSYKGFNLSVNISYSLGYVFRRNTTPLNYTELLTLSGHSDFNLRWQKPGDEEVTNIPSLVYPNNANRNTFFRNSEVLVTPGDHIRLQDIRFGYDFPIVLPKIPNLNRLQLFAYANNMGIIWRKNKYGLDPGNMVGGRFSYPQPLSISFGLTANF